MFSCYVTILENIRGSLTQPGPPFSDRSYASHSSWRNSSYVLRNFRRYNRSRVCVVSWIVVRSLTRFATVISSHHSPMCAISTMGCQTEMPTVPIAPRITERIRIEVAGGSQLTRFPRILDRVLLALRTDATSASGTTRGSPQVGAAADRPSVGRAFESGVASRSARD